MRTPLQYLLLLLALTSTFTTAAQADCRSILKKAVAAYDEGKGDLDQALQYLQDTEICDYKNTLQKERQALQKQIFGAIKKQKENIQITLGKSNQNVANYYTSEAQKAQAKDDSRLAYLLAKSALAKDPNNEAAQRLCDTLLPFLSTYTFGNVENLRWNADSSAVCFFTDVIDRYGVLHVFSVIQPDTIRAFPNTSIYMNFSPDGKLLPFFTKAGGDTFTLHILNVTLNQPPNTIKNIRFEAWESNYAFSKDSRFFSFFSGVEDTLTLHILRLDTIGVAPRSFSNIKRLTDSPYFSPNSKFITFYAKEKDSTFLHLFALEKQEVIVKCSNCKSYYDGFSSDDQFFMYFTNVDYGDPTGELHLLTLDKPGASIIYPNSYSGGYTYHYSNDRKYLVFYTNVDDKQYKGTLNLLELDNKDSLQSFAGSTINSVYFSPQNKHLSFFSDINTNNEGTLQILKLGEKQPRIFKNVEVFYDLVQEGYNGNYINDQFYVFFTVIKDTTYLHLLDLYIKESPRIFGNIYVGDYFNRYRATDDRKFFTFLTDVVGDKGTLHILDLNAEDPPRKFPIVGSYKIYNNRFVTFFTDIEDTKGTLHILDLNAEDPPRKFPIVGSYEIYNNRFVTFFTDLEDTKGTLHILDLTKNVQPDTFVGLSYDHFTVLYLTDKKIYATYQSKVNSHGGIGIYFTIIEKNQPEQYIRDVDYSFFSPDKRFLAIDPHGDYPRLYRLDKDEPPLVFENCSDLQFHSSLENQFLFLERYNNCFQLTIWDLILNKEYRNYYQVESIEKYSLSNNNRWLLLTNSSNRLKIIDLSIASEQQPMYYNKVLHFTKEEKKQYRIE